ncbi:MAG: hypothetical protein R3A46_16435 [Thermomicrobiales bacterium]
MAVAYGILAAGGIVTLVNPLYHQRRARATTQDTGAVMDIHDAGTA